MSAGSSSPRRFKIALSFPGEKRPYVEQVAKALAQAFGEGDSGRSAIFYDAWHESKVIGFGTNRRLQQLYADDSDIVVPFYCQDYLDKKWCGVELRAIEQLLFDHHFDRVLPFRFDMVEIPSSFKTDVFPVITNREPQEIARLILERYNDVFQTQFRLSGRLDDQHSGKSSVDISRIDKYAPDQLIGREAETKLHR